MGRDFEEYREYYEQLRDSGAMELIVSMLREAGVENPTMPSFEELLASGLLPVNELRVMAMNMVDPDRLGLSR